MWSEGWKQRWLGLRSRKMARLVPAGGEHPRLTPQGMGSSPLRGRGGGHSAHGPHTHTPGCHTPRSGTSWRAATRCTSYSRPRPGRCTSTFRFFSSPLSMPPMRPWSPSSTKTKNCTRYQAGGGAGETWGSCRAADTSSCGPCLPSAAGVPDRQPAGQARQEAHARGAATDVPADQ